MKRLFFFIFILLLSSSTSLFSHVQHYNKVKHLKYNLFFNDELIGYHTFDFINKDEILKVHGRGYFKVSKLGINIMEYRTSSKAEYKGNQLIKFHSNTTQNGKKKYVKIQLKDNKLHVDGSSFKGKTDITSMVSSWWNHEIVKKNKQISSISGRVIDQKVKFLGKDKININKNVFNSLNFHFFSNNDKPFNEKKLNIKIWYDAKTLLWIKASYEKFGTWEYKISEVKY